MKNKLKKWVGLVLGLSTVWGFFPGLEVMPTARAAVAGQNISLSSTGDVAPSVNGGTITAEIKSDQAAAKSGTMTIKNEYNNPAILTFTYSYSVVSGGASGDNQKTAKLVVAGTEYNAISNKNSSWLGTFHISTTTAEQGKKYNVDGSIELAAQASVTIEFLTAGNTGWGFPSSVSITISEISLVEKVEVQATFEPALHGTYTVDGQTITGAYSAPKQLSTVGFLVAAEADYGYVLSEWRWTTADGRSGLLMPDESGKIYPSESCSISPIFIATQPPTFRVGTRDYFTWEQAVTAAGASGTVILLADYVMPNDMDGNGLPKEGGSYVKPNPNGDGIVYILPEGVTLLVPFDEAGTCYTTKPGVLNAYKDLIGSYSRPTPYRTLTLSDGVHIDVYGAVSVSSDLSAQGTGVSSWNGTPSGKHGKIYMNDGSSITVKSSGKLYVYGYIMGSGNVLDGGDPQGITEDWAVGHIYAESGAEVWEAFQIRSWRGGSATASLGADKIAAGILQAVQKIDKSYKDLGIFPMTQYYVQNIEVPLTLEAGAVENAYTAVTAAEDCHETAMEFIGKGGLFQITSGKATKYYVPETDRMVYRIDGGINLGSLELSFKMAITDISINTADFDLSLNNNITLEILGGSKAALGHDLVLLPGTRVLVNEGATVDVSQNVYVYDAAQWKKSGEWALYACENGALSPVGYSSSSGSYTRGVDTLVNAEINVNGTINISGAMYTTGGGANITSTNGTGSIALKAGPGTQTVTHQATQASSTMTPVEIPVTPMMLCNADGTYTPTNQAASGETFYYKDGRWGRKSVVVNGGGHDGEVYTSLATAIADNTTAADGACIQAISKVDDTYYASKEDESLEACKYVIDKKVHLDLNGQSVSGVTVGNGGVLYGMDTGTNGLGIASSSNPGTLNATVAEGGVIQSAYQRVAGTNGGRSYIKVSNSDGNAHSFYRVRFGIDSVIYYVNSKTEAQDIFTITAGYASDAAAQGDLAGATFGMNVLGDEKISDGTGLVAVANGTNQGYVLRGTAIGIGTETLTADAILKVGEVDLTPEVSLTREFGVSAATPTGK